jgi:hypothetical protein
LDNKHHDLPNYKMVILSTSLRWITRTLASSAQQLDVATARHPQRRPRQCLKEMGTLESKSQWIGFSKKLQETPILDGKNHGFL